MANPSHQRGTSLASTTRSALAARRDDLSALVRRAPRRVRLAAPVAVLATLGVVGVGSALVDSEAPAAQADVASGSVVDDLVADLVESRAGDTSRSAERAADLDEAWQAWSADAAALAQAQAEQRALAQQQAEAQAAAEAQARAEAEAEATAAAVAAASTTRWATTDLDLRATAAADAEVVGLLEEGTEVLVTGRVAGGRDEVAIDGQSRWVTSGYLDDEAPSALGSGTCTTSSTPSGVTANIAALHEAVCAAWPQITDFGGTRTDGDHGRGLALDIMVRGDLGWEIAESIRANYTEWDVNYIIFEQQIWSVDRASEGWRPMEDRGSDTANHNDHVHVSVY